MRYSKIREMDISNGEGIGVSLFVQGCHFHCKGCFNPETWDFEGGYDWTEETQSKFIDLASRPYIERVSILGGEPLCDENVINVYYLIKEIKRCYPGKKIWLYTGYNADEIIDKNANSPFDIIRKYTLENSDYVIDGQFQIDKQDLFNEKILWAGSTNQRVIKIKDYLKRERE